VSGEFELLQTLKELLGDASTLGARQRAAKDAFSIMSDGVVNRVWDLVCRLGIDSQTNTLSS
jgi:3-deoxy-D-manno-octulosonic-acid transferase